MKIDQDLCYLYDIFILHSRKRTPVYWKWLSGPKHWHCHMLGEKLFFTFFVVLFLFFFSLHKFWLNMEHWNLYDREIVWIVAFIMKIIFIKKSLWEYDEASIGDHNKILIGICLLLKEGSVNMSPLLHGQMKWGIHQAIYMSVNSDIKFLM